MEGYNLNKKKYDKIQFIYFIFLINQEDSMYAQMTLIEIDCLESAIYVRKGWCVYRFEHFIRGYLWQIFLKNFFSRKVKSNYYNVRAKQRPNREYSYPA